MGVPGYVSTRLRDRELSRLCSAYHFTSPLTSPIPLNHAGTAKLRKEHRHLLCQVTRGPANRDPRFRRGPFRQRPTQETPYDVRILGRIRKSRRRLAAGMVSTLLTWMRTLKQAYVGAQVAVASNALFYLAGEPFLDLDWMA
jgi:hypothetical protein